MGLSNVENTVSQDAAKVKSTVAKDVAAVESEVKTGTFSFKVVAIVAVVALVVGVVVGKLVL